MKRLAFSRSAFIATVLFIGWAIIRAALVWETLDTYGVNPWVFLFLDILTAPFYVWGISSMSRGLRGAGTIRVVYLGGVVAIISFLVPYAYLFIAGSARMPGSLKIILVIIVIVLLGAGPIREVVKKTRIGKAYEKS